MKEARVEDYFCRRVKETGGEVRKVQWIGRRGAPDRLAGWPNGRYAFVEIKSDTQGWALQEHQAREMARMRSCGLIIEPPIWNLQMVDGFIERMTKA